MKQPLARRRIVLLSLVLLPGLAAFAHASLPVVPRVFSIVMAIVYGVSAVWFALHWWRGGQYGDEGVLLRETGQRLAESEDRFRLLFEHGGVGMALLSPDGDFVQVNPALIQMLGYPAAELIGKHFTDVLYAEDRSSGNRRNQKANSSQYEREKRFVRQDGRIVWARIVRVPIRDAQGEIRYYATIFVDVTERRRAQEALADSEQRLRLRFQQAFDGICLWSPAGMFLDANPALCRLLDRNREELLERNVAEVAADVEAIRSHLRAVLELSGDRCETRLRQRGGALVDVEVNSAVLEVEGQRLILGICRDISARKEAEAALRQAETALREERDFIAQILQTTEALILVADPHGRILRFNNKCQSVTGQSEEAVRGWPFWECVLPERVIARARETFHQVVAGADSPPQQVLEFPWRAEGGAERLIAWRLSLVRDAQGQPRHVIAIGLDVTEQRRLEEQFARARKMETLGTLVGGIAHDFNNQLTAILGNLDMVRGDLQKMQNAECRMQNEKDSAFCILNSALDMLLPCVLGAEKSAQRCASMTGRLLTFSRGRLGTIQPVALDQLVSETARALQHELPRIRIEMETPPAIWPVAADVAQVQEMLLNLATNARDAMPNGGVLTLSLANRTFTAEDCAANLEAHPGSFVELEVRDTGHGMTSEVRERLFEPFFTTRKGGQGTGMGLSVVFGIVKGHKGWITVSSQPGEGAVFHIYLPVAEALVPAVRPPLEPAQTIEGHILIVDDEPIVRELARTVLERWGFRVLTADGGEQALDIYRRQADRIAVILLDYIMPRMNGVQVLKELQRVNPEVCVVFSSGYSTDHDVDQLLAAGARGFVPKPYRPRDLVQAIRQALARGETASPPRQQG
ncbi:MAG TPA: PAS domain S-box protein [Gemmataceae bacterium]|nr:PAS domain S-box protein [Gemmataceae bacterium]